MSSDNNLKNFLLLFFLALCWGPSFLFLKIAVEYVQPFTITMMRVGIGSLLLYTVLKFKKIKFPNLKNVWKKLALIALIQSTIPFTLFAAGEQYVSSSIGAIINGTAPLFTVVIAHFATHDDRMSKSKISGTIIGFFGLFILILPSLFIGKSSAIGILALTIAAIFYSISFVYIRKNIDVNKFPPLTLPTAQLFFSFLYLLPTALIFEQPFSAMQLASTAAIASILSLGILGTGLAFMTYYKLVKSANATYISMVNYMTPVIGVFLGMMILNEELTWNSYLGCTMILSGVMIANGIVKFRKSKTDLGSVA